MTTGAEQGEIAEVGSPVVIPADPAIDTRHPWRWTTTIIFVATIVLAVGNADALTAWLDERPPTPVVDRLRPPIDGWQRAMAQRGLDRPHASLHHWWEAARALRFGSEHPGEPGTE